MIRSSLRRSVALALVSVAVVSACSSTLRDAATIRYEDGDGNVRVVHVRRDDLDDELEELAGNDAIRSQIEPSYPFGPDGSIPAEVSALWLNNIIVGLAVDAELAARGVEVTDEDLAAAEQNLGAFDSATGAFRELMIERTAAFEVLLDAVRGDVAVAEPTEADAREFFDENFDAITACPSGREVSHILLESADEAEAVIDELESGGVFADVAAERSTDPSAATNGGSLGCLGSTPFVEPFQQAADAAPLDELVGPVETEFGFHVILVNEWDPTFEAFRDRILDQLRQQADQSAQGELDAAFGRIVNDWLGRFRVHVDPRYGQWEANEADGFTTYQVLAPESPQPRAHREQRADDDVLGLQGG